MFLNKQLDKEEIKKEFRQCQQNLPEPMRHNKSNKKLIGVIPHIRKAA